MKILRKLNVLFFIGLLILSSCSKDNKEIKKESKESIKSEIEQSIDINTLVESAFSTDLTKEEEDRYINAFKSLNTEQLKRFNELCSKKSFEIESEGVRGFALDGLQQEKEDVLNLQNELINQSLELFDKPYNQLNQNERLVLTDKKKVKTNETEHSHQLFNTCPEHDFNGLACYKDANSGTSCHGLNLARQLNELNDCDYEFYFFGFQTKWYAKPWLVRTALQWWGGCLKCRYISPSDVSALLVGNRGVIAAGGANSIKYWCKTNP